MFSRRVAMEVPPTGPRRPESRDHENIANQLIQARRQTTTRAAGREGIGQLFRGRGGTRETGIFVGVHLSGANAYAHGRTAKGPAETIFEGLATEQHEEVEESSMNRVGCSGSWRAFDFATRERTKELGAGR